MIGYSYEELRELGIVDVTQKDDFEKEIQLYQQMVNGSIPSYRMEKQFIRRDGSLLWGEVARTMVHDEDGRPLYAIGGVLNITERKLREEEIRARTEEIEALMEVSPIGIFFAYDPECTRISANPAGYHLVEMPEDFNRERLQIGPGRRAAYLPDVPQRYRAEAGRAAHAGGRPAGNGNRGGDARAALREWHPKIHLCLRQAAL